MRQMAARILLVQTGVAVGLAALCLAVWGPRHGGSALAGGAIGVVANLYMSFTALRPTASAGGALARLFFGQFVKVGLTIALFVIVARTRAAVWPPLIAAYSALLGIFVPSGGSKWVLEAPYVMQAAHNLKVHLGWMVAVYDLGEALANLIQPFWMLPVLSLLGLKARDVMGITFTVFLVLLPVVLVMVTVLGLTLRYPL